MDYNLSISQKIPFEELAESLKSRFIDYSARNSDFIEDIQNKCKKYYENSDCKDFPEKVMDYGIQINDFRNKLEESKAEYYAEEQLEFSLDQETLAVDLCTLRSEISACKKENEELKIKLQKSAEIITQLEKENRDLKDELHESHKINQKFKESTERNPMAIQQNSLAAGPDKYTTKLAERNEELEENIKSLKDLILKHDSAYEKILKEKTDLENENANLRQNNKNLIQKIENIEVFKKSNPEKIPENEESQISNHEIEALKEQIQNLEIKVSDLEKEKEVLILQLNAKEEREETKTKVDHTDSSNEDNSANKELIKELRKKLLEYEEELRAKMKDTATIENLKEENENLNKQIMLAKKKEKDLIAFHENEKRNLKKQLGVDEKKTESKMQELFEKLAAHKKDNENLKTRNSEITDELEQTQHKLNKYKRKYDRLKLGISETSNENTTVSSKSRKTKN